MPKLPRLTGKKLLSILKKEGFKVARKRGSHFFLLHEDDRATVVPIHGSEIIGPGLLLKILKDCDIPRDEFIKMVK